MQEFNEGDLVQAVKGESVVRGRVRRGTDDHTKNYQYIGDSGAIKELYIRDGWTVAVIEKAAPKLPSEPGTVIAIGGWELVKLRLYNHEEPGGWELLPAKNDRVRRSMEGAGVKAQCVYSDEWVRAEVEQDRDGFRIISEPVPVTHARITPKLEEAARCIAKSEILRGDCSTVDILKGRRILADLIVELGVTE